MRSKSFEGNNARRDTEYVRGRTHSSMRHSSWRNMQVYGLDKVFGGEGAPPHDAYLDKLKDPRWYAFTDLVKRNREHCEGCGSNRHLQVHHIRYLPGLEPWEHPLSEVRLGTFKDQLEELVDIRSSRKTCAGDFQRQILTVVILAANHAEFGDPLAFLGKKIRVEGRLQEYRGALQIVANVARQIELR